MTMMILMHVTKVSIVTIELIREIDVNGGSGGDKEELYSINGTIIALRSEEINS